MFVLRAFVDDDVTGPADPIEHLRVVEIELALADLETVEKRLNQADAPVQARQVARRRDRRAAGRVRRAVATAGRSTAPASSPSTASCSRPYFLLTNRRVLAVVNVGEDDLDAIPEAEARVARRVQRRRRQRRGDRHVRAARGRGGDDRGPRRAGRDARGLRARRGRAVPDGPQRLPPARAAHVPHHRRQGVAGVDVLRRLDGARSAPGGSTPTSSAASSGPRSSSGTSCSTSARGRRPRSSARSASRARTTSPRTATSWSSASTSSRGLWTCMFALKSL